MTNLAQTTETNNNLEVEILKALALMQHNGEDFFIEDNTAYCGNYMEEVQKHQHEQSELTFSEWCNENLTEVEPYDEDNHRNDYLVLTDEEADEKAKKYILDSLWAFNASFIAYHTDLDEEVIQAIHDNGKCESNNDTIHNLIKKLGNIDGFVSDAISTDGRGHFLSSYDGCENEENVKGNTFYIYRQN